MGHSAVQLNTPKEEALRAGHTVVQLNTPKEEALRAGHVVQFNTQREKLYGTDTVPSDETPKRTDSMGRDKVWSHEMPLREKLYGTDTVPSKKHQQINLYGERHSVVQ